MPLYEFQCQKCGSIEEEICPSSDIRPPPECDICGGVNAEQWKRIPSAFAPPTGLIRDNTKWPYLGHVRGEDGQRVKFESRPQQEEWMKRNGYAYAPPEMTGVQANAGKMSFEVQQEGSRLAAHFPKLRKYLEDRDSGRIPSHLLLSEEQLKERFHV